MAVSVAVLGLLLAVGLLGVLTAGIALALRRRSIAPRCVPVRPMATRAAHDTRRSTQSSSNNRSGTAMRMVITNTDVENNEAFSDRTHYGGRLGFGVVGTAAAAPTTPSAVPAATGHVTKANVWFRHSWHETEAKCRAKGQSLVAQGLYKGYACSLEDPVLPPGWLLRVND